MKKKIIILQEFADIANDKKYLQRFFFNEIFINFNLIKFSKIIIVLKSG